MNSKFCVNIAGLMWSKKKENKKFKWVTDAFGLTWSFLKTSIKDFRTAFKQVESDCHSVGLLSCN